MGTVRRSKGLAESVEDIRLEAVRSHGVPAPLALAAGSITLRKFERDIGWDERGVQRVRAYFWGVVRRRALGSGADVAALRSRYVATTVAADMLAGGYPEHLVRDTVAACYGHVGLSGDAA